MQEINISIVGENFQLSKGFVKNQPWHIQTPPKQCHTVYGRNPAPVDMVNVALFTGFYTSPVVSRISSINSSEPFQFFLADPKGSVQVQWLKTTARVIFVWVCPPNQPNFAIIVGIGNMNLWIIPKTIFFGLIDWSFRVYWFGFVFWVIFCYRSYHGN